MGHRLVGLLLLLAGAVACGDDAGDKVVEGCPKTPTEGGFRLVVNPERLDLYRGESGSVQVWAMDRGACAAEVDVSIRGLPPGVSATSKTLGPDRTAAVLEVTVDPDADLVQVDLEIDVRSPSSFRTHPLPFSVRASGQRVENFGGRGVVELQEEDYLIDVALDDQGRVYVLLRLQGVRDHVRLVRLRPDGTVDESFLSERLPSEYLPYRTRWFLAIDEVRSRVYVAGRRGQGTVIHAVGESGHLDPTFGIGGELVIDGADDLLDMRLHPDALRLGGLEGGQFFFVEVDPTGKILTYASGTHTGDRANVGLVQEDGLILVKSLTNWWDAPPSAFMQSLLFRYGASESAPDPGFGQEGVVTQNYVEYGSLEPGPSGAIYACGYIHHADQTYVHFPIVQRWLPGGIVDSSFGFTGRGMSESVEFGLQVCDGIAPSPVGIAMLIQRRGAEPKLIQFTNNGKQDLRFGTEGVARLPSVGPAVFGWNDHTGIVVAQGEEGRILITRLHP